MSDNLAILNYNKFISLQASRINRTEWHKFPLRTRSVFYTYDPIERWLVRATEREKMFFLEDIGFTTTIVVSPNNNFSISDIPELSEYFFEVENRIKSVEKQLNKNCFAICTREIAVYFYNMSQNSNSKYFALKQDFAALKEASGNIKKTTFASAAEYNRNQEMREGILKFVQNVLTEFGNASEDLLLQHKIILLNIREFNSVGVKPDTIVTWFKGAVGLRQVQNYLSYLVDKGYLNRTGKKTNTIYILSASGMLYINDYCNRLMQL